MFAPYALIKKYSCMYFMGWLLFIISLMPANSAYPGLVENSGDYHINPTGEWVKKIDFIDAKTYPVNEISDGVFYLLIEKQILIQEESHETFRHFAIKIINTEGLSYLSQLLVDYDPSYQNLSLNFVHVYRQGEIINKLKRKNISILQRETELDYQIYNGTMTANLILNDIRVGDIVEYGYTISGQNPVFQNKFYDSMDTGWNFPVHHLFLRIVCPLNRKLYVKQHGRNIQSTVSVLKDQKEYLFNGEKLSAAALEDNLPDWFIPYPWIQISEAENWNAIASWGSALFLPADNLSEALLKQIDIIKKSNSNQEERIVDALNFVQNEIRYLGIEIGPGSHRPSNPSLTFERRFGDCKDKTYLLCTMLRELKIDVLPALVNTYIKDKLESFHPTPYAFDHVMARINLNGRFYWLDPTLSYQGGDLGHLYQPDYGKALILDKNTHSLCDMNPPNNKEPLRMVTEEFDLSQGVGKPCSLTVTTQLTGKAADSNRRRFSVENKNKIEKDFINFYASEYPSIKTTKPLSVNDDQRNNIFEIIEHYEINDFWKYSESESRHEGDYFAGEVDDLIEIPQTKIRTLPFGISYPVHHLQQVSITLPEDLKIKNKNVEVSDKAFLFTYNKKYENRRINLRYEYQALKDVVEVSDITSYLEKTKKVNEYLSYSFYKKTSSDDTISPAISAVIVIGGLILVFFLSYKARLSRSHYVISLLKDGDITAFLKEINNDIKNLVKTAF